MDKYKLTDETIGCARRTLYRIEALRDFGDVRAGDKGGWIESAGNLSQCGNCWVGDNARVYGHAWVGDNARVYGDAQVSGSARVYGSAQVYGSAWVGGDAQVHGSALIQSDDDWIVIAGLGSCNRTTTVCKCKDNALLVSCGCFSGTLDEFVAKVKDTHGDNNYGREYLALVEVAKIHFGLAEDNHE